jgi:hypothetical protein
MSHDRHLNNPPADSMGLMSAWIYATGQIMQKDPRPEDGLWTAAAAFVQIKGQWRDMEFLGLPLSSDVTVERIKEGMKLRDMDPRIVHAFDMVRGMYPDATDHAPAQEVYDRVREGLRFHKTAAAGTTAVSGDEPDAMSAVA